MAEVEVWSLQLEGGAEEAITPPADIRLTNISFGEDLGDANGRSVIKLGYQAITAEDMDSEEEEAPQLEGTYTTTFLGALTAGKIEQTTVNIVLLEDRDYVLSNAGKNTVYLTGNYIKHDNEPPYGDDELDSDEEGYDLEDVSSDVEMNPEELEDLEIESDASRFEEIKEDGAKPAKRARESEEKPKEAKEKKNKKLKAEDGKAAPAPVEKKEKKEKKKEDKAAVTKELPDGLKIQDIKVGDGAEAKKGTRVGMRYIGKLTNGNVFDKNTKGKPFYFKLGKGEVIKGWDEGIAGMKVGGERTLTIPPALAYGKQKLDGIPPNSTLKFEVKLLEVK